MGMATTEQSTADTHAETGVRRRDFINIAAVSFAGVGAATAVIPLVNQMNPSADLPALASIEADVSAIQPGQAIQASWRCHPVLSRNLTPTPTAEHHQKQR